MDLETSIRSRIEAILISDAKKYADLRSLAAEDEPFEHDSFEEERNLYQRIISSYRSAVNDVTRLLEENITFLSSFCLIVDSIKGKESFQEICSLIVDAVLQDLGVQYCSIMLLRGEGSPDGRLYLEGLCEEQKCIHIHTSPQMLGSSEFERAIASMVTDTGECVNIPDVYRDRRFNEVDFSSVVRSLVCLPVLLRGEPVGALVVSHSLPRFFNDNHIRLFKILAGLVSHLKLLTDKREHSCERPKSAAALSPATAEKDVISIMLLNLEIEAADARVRVPDKEAVIGLRGRLNASLDPHEIALLYNDRELLLLFPGTPAEQMPTKARQIGDVFDAWKSHKSDSLQKTRMNLAFASCDGTEDIAKTIEIASLMMHPDPEA